jgi:hypothetical protein
MPAIGSTPAGIRGAASRHLRGSIVLRIQDDGELALTNT